MILIAALIVSAFDIVKLLSNFETDQYTIQAQKIFDDAHAKVEQTRGVTLPNGITLHIITKQDAVNMWGKPSGTVDLTNINRQEKIYKGLFMMPQSDSLYQATSDWTANWAAATVGKSDIYVIRENFNPFDKNAENTFIHELTHIWQPQLETPTTYDEDKAHTALVEGDASFMGDNYLNWTNSQASIDLPVYLIDNPILDTVHPMSKTLWSLDYFPYDQGKTFVTAIYQQGGFTTINQAYKSGYTPSSTMQILHPEKYFSNETAHPVNSPNLADNPWTLAQTDRGQNHNTYGEYFIQAMLATWLNQTTAQQAAAGWAGDNFTYYEKGNDYLYTWNIQWASSLDAGEFSNAFQSMVNATGQAVSNGVDNWSANGRYFTFDWNQGTNSTLVAVSTVQNAVQQSNFS